MKEIVYIIGLPITIGILLFLVPERLRQVKGLLTLVVSIITFYFAIAIFSAEPHLVKINEMGFSLTCTLFGIDLTGDAVRYITFNIDKLSSLICLFVGLFATLISLYSLVYINNQKKIENYYEYFLITLGATFGAIVSDNLLLFVSFWGVLGITLYKLIRGSDEESSSTAKKTLIIIGASDGIMILGIAIIWRLTNSLSISETSLQTNTILPVIAFLCLLVGSFTKAGAFPFHSWIPDYAKSAPASSSAYLPASLDKLLGIYFLGRITMSMFEMNQWISLFLLTIGVITIITAVMMALVQHNYKRLLGYHAVSQVGYMVLGFGLGSLIGVAAGLFHMINHALYKSGLLMSAGCVEHRTQKENIEDLGGLSSSMPITFITALIFALSISGIPPLNGFASKWMIYQGIVEFGNGAGIANKLWVVWLGLAVLGSALTLASFIKFIGGIFLSRKRKEFENVNEVSAIMWIPLVVLAALCIGFGVFASGYIVPNLFMPITGNFEFIGFWNSTLVSILILVSILLGFIIYLIGNIKNFRSEDSFIGGETMQESTSFSTPEFYKTISEFKLFYWIYQKAEDKWFDIYDLSKKVILWFSSIFSKAHTGLLQDYALWMFIGLIIMLLVLA